MTTPQPDGTPFADNIILAAGLPARDRSELNFIGDEFMSGLVRLIVSVLTAPGQVSTFLLESIIAHPCFGTIVVERAREGLADDLAAPRTVVHEVNLKNVRIEQTYDTHKVPAGTSWIAVLIGVIAGLVAGTVAMMVLNASPVRVDVADQTASVGIAQAVDQPWFIIIAIILTMMIGGAIGSFKQKTRTVRYITDLRLIANEN